MSLETSRGPLTDSVRLAGTLRQAELKPKLPDSFFAGINSSMAGSVASKSEAKDIKTYQYSSTELSEVPDEFSDYVFDDDDLIAAGQSRTY